MLYDIKYIKKNVNPKEPSMLPNMYKEMPKKAHSTVKKINIGKLERAKELLKNARVVINKPNNAKIATLRMGSDISITMLAKRVTNITACIPLSKPKNLAINPANIIKLIARSACPHLGLPVGFEILINLSKKPLFVNFKSPVYIDRNFVFIFIITFA